ncbi:MAG: sulfotransferase [Caulobacteraceae bacterium]
MAMKVSSRRRRSSPPRGQAGASHWLSEAAAHMAAGRLAEAVRAYERAERADPADFRAPMSLATIALQRGEPRKAVPGLRRAASLRPDLFDAWHNLGAASQALERWDEAREAYEAALALNAEALETRRNLAIVLAVLGRIEAAGAHHRRLAEHPETRFWALTRLALLGVDGLSEDELSEMDEAASNPAVALETRIGLTFALGEALERRGRDEAAFGAFAAGNRLKRASVRVDPVALVREHAVAAQAVASLFAAEFLREGQGRGVSTATPIFVVGMPRSGSTLIEQILSSHPEVAALGETAVLPPLLERGLPADLRELGRRYLEGVRAKGWRGAGRFVDKTLENYLHVGAIALALPNATILHAVRDPIDTCLSCYRQLFATGAETLYDLAEIGAEYVTYRRLMDHWRAVLPGRVIDVEHEALVGDPEGRIRWLVEEACGLAWSDACLAFHEAARPVRTASSGQVRRPIFTSSVRRWRRYEAHLGPLLEALGPYAEASPSGSPFTYPPLGSRAVRLEPLRPSR